MVARSIAFSSIGDPQSVVLHDPLGSRDTDLNYFRDGSPELRG
jgi:hypothetical protein